MFESSLTAEEFIDLISGGMGLLDQPSNSLLFALMDDCLAHLYGEVICERGVVTAAPSRTIDPSDLFFLSDQAQMSANDVTGVRVGGLAYRYLTPDVFAACGDRFGLYTIQNGCIELSLPPDVSGVAEISYILRPARTARAGESRRVPMPDEYLPLVAAYIRGEAYKLANEDALAAKWLSEYNTLLAEFAAFVARRNRERAR